MDDELAEIFAELAHANAEMQKAVAAGDSAAVALQFARLSALEKRRNRAIKSSTPQPIGYAGGSTRDLVIAALNVIGSPSPVKLVADVARALFSEQLDTSKLAATRRDERTSWEKAHDVPPRATAREAYIVPALSIDWYLPVRGIIALSSWDLPDRLMGPSSHRVNFLAGLLRLSERVGDSDGVSALDSLLRSLARTLPGASFETTGDLAWVRRAASAELDQIAPRDLAERSAAGERAAHLLSPEEMLFGPATPKRRATA
ncbi:hypothetical protein [Leifsonia aquatica]|uniref:hypothetical protein n=1 Tax=Leifsonia aquatica TaxID=144185 RepID=UPI00380454FA